MDNNKERLKRLKDKANGLPKTPGVYIMKNSSGDIIYIGKAKSLKNRVTQYFSQKGQEIKKTQKMVDNVTDFDYILTDSEFEALVLECSLIKQHRPKYNILLKDDKGYHYIKITNGDWKNFSFVNRKQDDGCTYLGPYINGFLFTQSIHDMKKIFKLSTCSKEFPRDIGKGRPCLNYYISQCSAPCAGKISRDDYNRCVEDALDFLKGSDHAAVKQIKEAMEQAAQELNFERAAVLRDRLSAIEKASQKQKVVSNVHLQQDVFALVLGAGKVCFAVLRFMDGRLCDNAHYILDEQAGLGEMRSSFIAAYYASKQRIPPRITVDGEVEDEKLLERFLSERKGSKTQIVIPVKGEQAKLVEMCRTNAEQKLSDYLKNKEGKKLDGLLELQTMLGLGELPRYIEAYDISHLGGQNAVGGMVVFKDGKPLKRAYRRFSIKSFEGQDDCRALFEVVDRRLGEYEKTENKGNGEKEGFKVLPELILVDGGNAQVKAVNDALKKHNIEIPLFGMVKNAKHRTTAIAAQGGKIEFNVKKKAFTLVTNIQDEVHRFAIEYHKNKRSKSSLSSQLLDIQGIGETRAKALLKHFKTIKAIGGASIEELNSVKGISLTAAQEVYKKFH